MLPYVIKTYQNDLAYARKLVADIPEDRMAEQPAPEVNHPAFILGHLVGTDAFTAQILGIKTPPMPENWAKLFGLGAKPQADRRLYPTKAELLARLEDGHRLVTEAVAKLPAGRLAEPFPMEQMREFVPTLGDGLVFLMTAHEATHLGQLSAWRRVLGFPSVM